MTRSFSITKCCSPRENVLPEPLLPSCGRTFLLLQTALDFFVSFKKKHGQLGAVLQGNRLGMLLPGMTIGQEGRSEYDWRNICESLWTLTTELSLQCFRGPLKHWDLIKRLQNAFSSHILLTHQQYSDIIVVDYSWKIYTLFFPLLFLSLLSEEYLGKPKLRWRWR